MTFENGILNIGWASADITPSQPVLVGGQFHARVSEGVADPLSATALVLESVQEGKPVSAAILVCCDFAGIPDGLRDMIRDRLRRDLPELDPTLVTFNATHTHCAPEISAVTADGLARSGWVSSWEDLDLGVMNPVDYAAFAADRIAEAIAAAWNNRKPGGIGYGLGHAVVGHNRRISYYSGETRMYGQTNDPEFSHIEGGEDHALNLLCTYDGERKLTGIVINVACPSQTSEHDYQLSADFWCETRQELRQRFGDDLFILPQVSAAGELTPHVPIGKAAEARMWKLAGRTQRQEIALRIADAVTSELPLIEKEIDYNPLLSHRVETVELPRRNLSQEDVDDALAIADDLEPNYQRLKAELQAHPEKRDEPRWYVPITATYRAMKWNEGVADRYALQDSQPVLGFESHVIRIGDVVIATNPFEYYLDFGMQIKARSRAMQTFIVQLAGPGSYLPTLRATTGKSYGALPASTIIGPDGGRELVDWTVGAIDALYTG